MQDFFLELKEKSKSAGDATDVQSEVFFQQIGHSNDFIIHDASKFLDTKASTKFLLDTTTNPIFSSKELDLSNLDGLLFMDDEESLIYPLVDKLGKINFDHSSLYWMDIGRPRTDLDVMYDYTTGDIVGFCEVDISFKHLVDDSCNVQESFLSSRGDKIGGSSENCLLNPNEEMMFQVSYDGRKLDESAIFDDLASKGDFFFPGLNFGIKFDEFGVMTVLDDELCDEPSKGNGDVDYDDGVSDVKDNEFYEDILRTRKNEKLRKEEKMDYMLQISTKIPEFVSKEMGDVDPNSIFENEEISSFSEYLNSELDEGGVSVDINRVYRKKVFDSGRQWISKRKIAGIAEKFFELVPDPAIIYDFEMDEFQKEAVYYLEQGESVFVAAHTSAGKTVVAEYAIALSLKHGTRAIYTSPIKALSNQKYRDFCSTFGDRVGLVTGDVSVNSEASCLIVTTEILRNMLYKGAEVIRDVEWIIFDEIHYINDFERGVVWEEVIIMLPRYVNMVFLSATVHNTLEFAEWVGLTKKKVIHVISMEKRPVPLEHNVYYMNRLFKIADDRAFYEENYKHLRDYYNDCDSKAKKKNRNTYALEANEWNRMLKLLSARNLMPCIVFVFSKARCSGLANHIKKQSLVSAVEREKILRFFDTSVKRLREQDQRLPQIMTIRSLLEFGIGIHNSGLIPMMKEVVEILFSKGLVKILFSTETFAMGVNMPAKAVVFHSLKKCGNDGVSRFLTAGEYTQMSGRAGRRGLDRIGVVIIMAYDSIPEMSDLKDIVKGYGTSLISRFRLSYNMILNLMKINGEFRIEDMIRRSFSEVDIQKKFEIYTKNLKKFIEIYNAIGKVECEFGLENAIEDYYDAICNEQEIKKNAYNWLITKNCSSIATNGRVLLVRDLESRVVSYAVICKTPDIRSSKNMLNKIFNEKITILVLAEGSSKNSSDLYYLKDVELNSKEIELITNLKLNKIEYSKILKKNTNYIETVVKELNEIRINYLNDMLPAYEVKNFSYNDSESAILAEELRIGREIRSSIMCDNCHLRKVHFEQHSKRVKLKECIGALEYVLSDKNMRMASECKIRVNILKTLNYVSDEGYIQLKGRVAREINSCDELLGTELIFEGVLSYLEADEIASLLSALVYEGNRISEWGESIFDPLKGKVIALANRLAVVQVDCGLDISPREYIERVLNFDLMDVVYEWCHDVPFEDITKRSKISEGIVVKTILRVNEALKEFKNASKIVGDVELEKKLEDAMEFIRRDIAFSSSLYITEATYTASDGSALAN